MKPAKNVEVGKTASVGANIENPKGRPLQINWHVERGNITSASESSAAGIYTAPLEPGPDSITLEVRSGGKLIASKVAAINVTGAAGVMVPPTTTDAKSSQWPTLQAPIDVTAYYIPSGFMGDGEQITLNDAYREDPHSPPICTKITYKIGPKGWGGFYYQYPEHNWGDLPGYSIQGAKKVTFWAKGLEGDEVVEFKAGGIRDFTKKHQDSFLVSLGRVALTRTWKQYEIDLSGQDLSKVIGAFVWVASRAANPKGHLTFYLDDIRYE
ncbi:TPA: hypothetical protein EYP66_12220 [Candidatus Poribacteria bacterium]|nr:hypothetical protein [Candidatus Poribacteria bacterium]